MEERVLLLKRKFLSTPLCQRFSASYIQKRAKLQSVGLKKVFYMDKNCSRTVVKARRTWWGYMREGASACGQICFGEVSWFPRQPVNSHRVIFDGV